MRVIYWFSTMRCSKMIQKFKDNMYNSSFFVFTKSLQYIKWKVMEHSVEKRVILSHWKKIRQISYLVISLVKPLLSRNFCEKSVGENFCNFHTALCGNRKISSNCLFRKNVTFTKFLSKMCETKSQQYPHCGKVVEDSLHFLFSRNFCGTKD